MGALAAKQKIEKTGGARFMALHHFGVAEMAGKKMTRLRDRFGCMIEDTIEAAEKNRLIIVPNSRWDVPSFSVRELIDKPWRTFLSALPCITGTSFGYVEPNRSFREGGEYISQYRAWYIVLTDPQLSKQLLYPIPEQYLDVRNGILVMNHPFYELHHDGNARVFVSRSNGPNLVERFPVTDGEIFNLDPQYSIPTEATVTGSMLHMPIGKLHRKAKMVSLAGRDQTGMTGAGDIVLDRFPSDTFLNVLMEY